MYQLLKYGVVAPSVPTWSGRSFQGVLHLAKKGQDQPILRIPIKGFVLPPR